ncbi:MAG: bifunctional DNA-binding transcriptional regulator/O6-methylguanine-DNA methyltransferase Ada [Acidobacteriaceae bacterium]
MQTLMTTTTPIPITLPSNHLSTESGAAGREPTGKIPSLFAGKAWQQVLARDASADGQFVYAVKSTRIFCRPSCPSRRPTRKNVTFFPSPTAAEAAGYRACKRCEPTLATPRVDPQAAAIATVTGYLTAHASERTRLADVVKATGVPRLTILRGFKRVLGVSPGQFAKAQRLSTFKDRLKPSARAAAPRVTDAIYDAGFGSSSRLYEDSSATLGMTPTALRSGAPSITIRYALADCPLGRTLVAATPAGICAIAFANSDAVLRHDLRERFPRANLVEASLLPRRSKVAPNNNLPEEHAEQGAWLVQAVQFVLAQLSEHPVAATFPLDVRSTAFQHRVWQALQQIPRGHTLSYAAVARQLGQPSAARAVATACAANPVALAIPCHRVVGSSGALVGYRWGVERKEKILAHEAV